MGRDKALLAIQGQTLLERVVALFEEVFDAIIMVRNSNDWAGNDRVRVAADLIPNKGSLGGIYSGLTLAPSHHAFFAACDMPFLNKALIHYLMGKAPGFDVVVPVLHTGYQPLHAVYSKNCLPHIQALLTRDELKITNFFQGVAVRPVEEEEILPFDPDLRSFFNINTAADLDLAEKMACR